ncbi:hypothetical protein QQ045_012245 [Rhodiola kirilowii]
MTAESAGIGGDRLDLGLLDRLTKKIENPQKYDCYEFSAAALNTPASRTSSQPRHRLYPECHYAQLQLARNPYPKSSCQARRLGLPPPYVHAATVRDSHFFSKLKSVCCEVGRFEYFAKSIFSVVSNRRDSDDEEVEDVDEDSYYCGGEKVD